MNKEQDKNSKNIDNDVINILFERINLLSEEIKNGNKSPEEYFSPSARAEFFKSLDEANSHLPEEVLRSIYNEIITRAVNMVKPVRVAYLGPPGTFSHIAMIELFGESVESVPLKEIHEVFSEVEMRRADFAVVPVENSTEGAVTYTLDELLDSDMKVLSEKYLRISYCLASVCSDIKNVKKLYSHPQSFAQCKDWIKKNLPSAEIHNVSSTSLAAEAASWDKYSAAITSSISAENSKLHVLASNIEDSQYNYTRFFVIGDQENPPSEKDKTSIICAVHDRPGALYNILIPFKEFGINMTKIESRPDKKKLWEYNFFIDFIGHKDNKNVKNAIERMQEYLIFLKILGSYPAEK